jgi:very-short-patch-repair endonuclease
MVRSALPESPEQEVKEPLEPPQESKALRLARYLKEFVGLRSTTIRDVDKYESVLWFADMPQVTDCQSAAWNDTFEPGEPWLVVRKQRFPKPPDPSEIILPWIDQQALRRATPEMPQLRQSIFLPDAAAEVGPDEDPPLVELPLTDHPEISNAYKRYRPSWEAWSAEYRRREAVQVIYAELFNLHTQVLKQGEIVELILGLGLLDWRNPGEGKAASIRRHLVAARVDLHFDAVSGTMRLEGATDGAQLRIEDDMLEAEMRPERGQYDSVSALLSAIGDDVWDHAQMHRALRSWAEALHPDSQWSESLKPDTGSETKPIITFAPALILRKRNQVGMVRIYDELISRLGANVDETPLGWRGLVEDEDDRELSEAQTPFDERNGQSRLEPQEIYFPLPANRQQKQIVEALDRRRGVLVQGPPGTGKSHTIANLMCHLLATGKRVLITAETGRALQVLKDKLPLEIQPLCVSLLGQGGDAFAELNSAVQGITTRHATYSDGDYKGRIAEIDGDLDSTRRSLAKIDTELRSLREGETCPHSIANGAYQGTASAIAERVANESEVFCWLRIPQDSSDNPPLNDAELTDWLRILRSYSDEVVNSSKRRILATEGLPTPAEFGAAVSIEREANAAVERIAELRGHPAYSPILALGANGRSKLAEHLRVLDERRQKLDRFRLDWIDRALTAALTGRHAVWQALRERTHELISHIERLLTSLGPTSVSMSVVKDPKAIRADATAIIQHLQAGGKWKKLAFFTPEVVKERMYFLHEVAVDGQPADTIDRLQAVCKHVELTVAIDDVQSAWIDHGGLPAGSDLRMRVAAIKEQVSVLTDALHFADSCMKLGSAMKSAASPIPEPDWLKGEVQEWLKMIDAAAQEERKKSAADQVTKCLRDLGVTRDMFDAHPLVGAMMDAVEHRNVTAYSQIYADVQGIEQTRRDQLRREQVEIVLNDAVPGLIGAVTESLSNEAWDTRFRSWTKSWHWALADSWLQKRSDREYQQKLWERRLDAEKAIRQLLAESAALRAWSHFFARLSTKESAALKSWREAVRAMGKGTGKSAKMERLRREARQYMDQCREAIPVWIMPRYLVAEMIEPAPGRYDVVIVDEASQLGVESLFLFYIAKKMVVVGDDQQISPYGVGIADEAIAGLQHHYLDGVPHHHALQAQSSLYGNAKIRFGQNIVLREHFRCMPEIIQFSNDLCYASNGTPLDPLRSYPANRLQPLVVRHVPDGYRKGSSQNALNEPEADALVAQIIACIADPRYAGRTMGVISLQGDTQAKLIEHKILGKLEPEVISERRLICGDAYAFQGDERHIIFLSMVAAPNERIGALAVESARQRFNVAASRAQDQMWLFHSVELDVLSLSCMRHRLLGYMLNPGRLQPDGEQKFDSQFERDVFRAITQRNFHVRTQVCVGDPTNHRYRIDLVVEGMEGRLAVECDGDQWHGPDRYDQDMARQRDLERAGWKFVRIRGSDFYRDRVRSLDVLWAELHRLGIEPGGVDEAAAAPPAPSDHIGTASIETDEIIAVDLESDNSTETDNTIESVGDAEGEAVTVVRGVDQTSLATASRSDNGYFGEYVAFEGPAGEDPRTLNVGEIAEGLCRIVNVEGPMIAKRAYDIYLRGCGIKRMGHELKSTMNKALANAIRRGRIVSEDELGKKGFLFSVIRIKETPPIKLRSRGPRAFEEIPPSELLVVARRLVEQHDFNPGSDEHLRAILECFDLKRLTTSVGTTLLEVLETKIAYVDDFLLSQIE